MAAESAGTRQSASPLLPDLAARVRRAELMDDPALEPARHLRALDALARVNRVSLTAARVWSEIVTLSRQGLRPVRVLDVGCGGGDVLQELARRSTRHAIAVELHGCDLSPVALGRAAKTGRGTPALQWHRLDALRDPLPGGCHVVCSSLLLHHLERELAVALLEAMAAATGRVLLVQDLRRTRLGYLFAWLGLMALTRSDVARSDGLVSVRAAFSMSEAGALCRAAGLEGAEVRACWPQRFTLRWVRR